MASPAVTGFDGGRETRAERGLGDRWLRISAGPGGEEEAVELGAGPDREKSGESRPGLH